MSRRRWDRGHCWSIRPCLNRARPHQIVSMGLSYQNTGINLQIKLRTKENQEPGIFILAIAGKTGFMYHFPRCDASNNVYQ